MAYLLLWFIYYQNLFVKNNRGTILLLAGVELIHF